MSIDLLHDKVRKLKNPSMIELSARESDLPAHLLEEEGNFLAAHIRFCRELLEGLKGMVPAVRFSFDEFAVHGPDGLTQLRELLALAGEMGYYVLLESPAIHSPWGADRAAKMLLGENGYPCDGLMISPYIGSDAIKPFVPFCKDGMKDLFVIIRSPNKSASDLQDLYTGSRLVHNAAADIVNRFGETILGRCGYSRIGGVISAGATNSIRTIRGTYNRMYLLVDGLDYPSGNHKNCSHAFDRFGYGAVVCAGPSVTCAWKEAESDGRDYAEQARQAAERMKKNLTRYITIL